MLKKIMIALLCFTLIGCASKDDDPTKQILDNIPAISDDYFEILGENLNCDMNLSDRVTGITLIVISSTYFNEEQCQQAKVKLITQDNQNMDYDYDLIFNEEESLPYYAYLSYKDIDWTSIDSENDPFEEEREIFCEIDEDTLPKLYKGVITLYFNLSSLKEDIEVTGLNLELADQTYSCDFNHVHLSPESSKYDLGEKLTSHTLAIMDSDMGYAFDGEFTFGQITLDASDDLQISNIYFEDNDIQINEAEVTIEKADNTITCVWNKNDQLNVNKGDHLEITLNCYTDSAIKKESYYNYTKVLVEYIYNNQSYVIPIECGIRKNLSPYMIYIIQDENSHFWEYYYNY